MCWFLCRCNQTHCHSSPGLCLLHLCDSVWDNSLQARSVPWEQSRQLMSFRCPGQTALRQADAQRLVLIADACQWRWCRNDTSSSLHRLLNSQLGCSRCQCFTPETLVRVVISRRAGKKQEKLQDNCILIIWVLISSFKTFRVLELVLALKLQLGGGK